MIVRRSLEIFDSPLDRRMNLLKINRRDNAGSIYIIQDCDKKPILENNLQSNKKIVNCV